MDALDDVLRQRGGAAARDLLARLERHLSSRGQVLTGAALNTPYKNTIDLRDQPAYPGDIDLETRIGNIIRWNAVAMVLQAYDSGSGVGGHIATYLSAATMMEVGFNHSGGIRGRSGAFSGSHSTGRLCARVSGRAGPGTPARQFPARARGRWGSALLSASKAFA
jgi:pyruvate dehydrogenase E1 component